MLATRFGSRVVIGVSMLVVSAAVPGLAPGYPLALVGRTLTGMGSGGANVPVMALVSA